MIITLEPNQWIEIRFAHGRDEHGDPLLSDGAITVRYDDEKKRIRVEASEPDSSGRKGVVYQENFDGGQQEEIDAVLSADDELLSNICRIVAEHLGVEREVVETSSSIMDDLGADSLDLIELVMAFEWEYGIEIPDADADGIHTVSDILAYLHKKI